MPSIKIKICLLNSLGSSCEEKRSKKPLESVIIVFVLSHGQIDVERGYSVYKEMLVENLEKVP